MGFENPPAVDVEGWMKRCLKRELLATCITAHLSRYLLEGQLNYICKSLTLSLTATLLPSVWTLLLPSAYTLSLTATLLFSV
jgi:hypothetical protein